MHKLQVPHIFGETPPPRSTAGEDVVMSVLEMFRNTCGLVVTFFLLWSYFVPMSFWYLNLLLDIPRLERVLRSFLMRNSTGTG